MSNYNDLFGFQLGILASNFREINVKWKIKSMLQSERKPRKKYFKLFSRSFSHFPWLPTKMKNLVTILLRRNSFCNYHWSDNNDVKSSLVLICITKKAPVRFPFWITFRKIWSISWATLVCSFWRYSMIIQFESLQS